MSGYLLGRSRNPPRQWAEIELAAYLNAVLGTAFITPWNLGEIPEHWIDAIIRAKNLQADMVAQGLIS